MQKNSAAVFRRAVYYRFCSVLHRCLDRCQQLIISLIRREIRVVVFDLVGALKEEAGLAGPDHAEVVVAVAAGNGLKADGLQSLDGAELGLLNAHLKSDDLAVLRHLQLVAENSRPAQLFHKRLCDSGF